MKNEKQQQAKNLYFQSNLSKTEIAEMLDVNRRTVMLWVEQGNWDRLKMSSQHLPSMVAEKCYYMLNHYLDNLLSVNSIISTFGPKEASAINALASSIKKINNRSAVNESMEMFSFFLDDVRRKDPDMADAIRPLIETYVAKRKDVNITDFLPAGFNNEGFLNYPENDMQEQWLDDEEYEKMEQERKSAPVEPQPVSKNATESPNNELDDNSDLLDGGTPVEPTKPPVIVSPSNYTPPSQHAMPAINDHKTPSQARKLSRELEKQLTEYLRKSVNTAA